MRAGLLAAAFFVLAGPAAAATYDIDPAHSSVGFRVRHLMVSRVNGKFDKFSGTFDYDPKDPRKWAAKASIEAASVNTNNDKRDAHLKSADFFDAEKFPALEFVSTGVRGWRGSKGKLAGKLTMHGVTKDVVLDLEANGTAKDPWGGERAGFSASVKLNRQDYGVSWNKALEAGGVMVSDEVEVTLEVEGVKKK